MAKVAPALMLWLLTSVFLLSAPGAASGSANPVPSTVDLGTVPRGVAVNPGSGVVYAVLYLNGTTIALEPQTLHVFGRVTTPSPYAVAVNSRTGDVYVSQGEGASVAVIDNSANQVLARVQGAGTPYAMAVDEPQNLLFAADTAGNSLWVINGSSDAVKSRLPMGDTSALTFDPDTHQVFVGNLSSDFRSGSVTAYSSVSLKPVWTVQIPIPPQSFAVDPVAHLLFVSGGEADDSQANFVAINETTMKVVYSHHVGESPGTIVAASSSHIYVSDQGQNRLYELDGLTGQVLLNSSGDPQSGVTYAGITSMAFDAGSGRLYITERESTDLIILDSRAAAPGSDLSYLYLGLLAVAVIIVGSAVLWQRRARLGPKASQAGQP